MAFTRKGVKRKHGEDDDAFYRREERQTVMDLSIGKLQPDPLAFPRVEPGLRRSVLILNTLKKIEIELFQEDGMTSYSYYNQPTKDAVLDGSTAHMILDPLPDMSSFMFPLPNCSPVPMSVDLSPAAECHSYLSHNSSVVNLLPVKPLEGSPGQALPHTSSMFYDTHSQAPGLPQSPEFFDTNRFFECVEPPGSSTLHCDAASLDSPSSSMMYFNNLSSPSLARSVPVPVAKPYDSGDSNNNSTAQGPYNTSSNTPSSPDLFPSLSDLEMTAEFNQLLSMNESVSVSSAEEVVRFEEYLRILRESDNFTSPSPASSVSSAPVTNTQSSACPTSCRADSAMEDLETIMQILVGM